MSSLEDKLRHHDQFAATDQEVRTAQPRPPAWETPIPLDDLTGPAFPLDALPDTPDTPLRRLVEATAAQTQAPPDIAAWCALSVIGAAVRGRLEVRVRKDWREPVHIQSLQVLVSGGGKGPTYKVLTQPLYLWDAQEKAKYSELHREWEHERRIRDLNVQKARSRTKSVKATADDEQHWRSCVKALVEWEQQEPTLRRIVASNTTAEALEKRIYEQGGAMAVISAEGGFLANITGAYSDTPKLGVLLHGYSGEPFENDRKTDNEQWRVDRSCVAVSLAVQPHVLEAMGKVDGFQNLGAAARFLVTCPQPVTWPDLHPPDIPDDLIHWWNWRIMEIADGDTGTAAGPVAMELSPAAQEAFDAERMWWRQASVDDVFADMTEWGRKYPGQVVRIAGLLHILQEPAPQTVPIPAEVMASAIFIMRNAIEHARIAHALLHGMGEQSRERDVLDVVMRLHAKADGELTSAAVYDRLRGRHAFQKAETVVGALRVLEERRSVRLERREGPGPPTYAILVNPLHTSAKMRSFPEYGSDGAGKEPNIRPPPAISQFRRLVDTTDDIVPRQSLGTGESGEEGRRKTRRTASGSPTSVPVEKDGTGTTNGAFGPACHP